MIPRIAIVAPTLEILGGQGIQAGALADALRADGYAVDFVPINPRFPGRLAWLRRLPYVRTLVNETLYLLRLSELRRADVVHVFSASYWSFVLAPLPAILAARILGKRVLLNYRSGEADDHLARWGALVRPWLRLVDDIVVPSEFLRGVFARHGYRARVIPNVVDLSHFRYRERNPLEPRLVSTRNLESLYRIDTIIEALALIKARYPAATLTLAGTGSDERRLRRLAGALGIDNQPVSILEAFAAGLPVVSTATGDIANLIRDGERGLLVPPADSVALAKAVTTLLDEPERARRMARRARSAVERYTWSHVRELWACVYAGRVA